MPKKVSDAVKELINKQQKQISIFDLFDIEDIIIKVRKK